MQENNLCSYYDLDKSPGIKVKGKFTSGKFGYLDNETLVQKLVSYNSDTRVNVIFLLPQMHCSSCVYLLENLHRIEQGILSSRVNFQRKEIFISFNPEHISFRKVVELLSFIGYEPAISLKDAAEKTSTAKSTGSVPRFNKKQLYRIGVAGFCFSNIMMLSFPEYLSSGNIDDGLKQVFTWLVFLLSFPVLFFCSGTFFESAWKGLRQRYINIDLPIALAIVVTFARSYYEIMSGHGAGYLDSGSGIVFFMLIGRWFQNKTYDSLSFDRDYRSFFPLGVTILDGSKEKNVPVTTLKKTDHIKIRNGEMIPADAILLKGEANIDYSFVSGENLPVHKKTGELLHAGGKQCGNAIELEIIKEVSQSYITELWNNDVFNSVKNKKESFIHPWSRYFTAGLFTVALSALIFWWIKNPANILPAVTAVLIVACPCSLLLSATFTYGNMLRVFGKNRLYLKNANLIERLALIDTIIFDKTGTITTSGQTNVSYHGITLTDTEKGILIALCKQSNHPLSRIISESQHTTIPHGHSIKHYNEYPGKGISAVVNDHMIMLGSGNFIGSSDIPGNNAAANVHVKIGNEYKGSFSIKNNYRSGIRKSIAALKKGGYKFHVLSGDNSSEQENLRSIFGKDAVLKFGQTPIEKLEYTRQLQVGNKKVLMIGDGLNDSGALRQADIGISINNNNAQFTPACDAILAGDQITALPRFLHFAKSGKKIVTGSFILSIIYNVVGLSFAVSAHLSPMVAAILMPASSISIVLFVTLASTLLAKKQGL